MSIDIRSELASLSRDQLIDIVVELRSTNVVLAKRVSELEKQLGYDDKPPSSPSAPKKAKPKVQSKPRKKRTLHFARRREPATKTEHHVPETCPDCGRRLSGGGPGYTRQIIELIPAHVVVTDHVVHDRYCGVCKKRVRAKVDFSDKVCGKRRIGHNLTAFIAHLNIVGRMPLRTIMKMLEQQCGAHVSLGEMVNLLHLVAQKAQPKTEQIHRDIRADDCVYSDETGWRESGIYRCLWSLSTRTARFYHIDEHRTAKVAEDLIGSDFVGTLVTDFCASYNKTSGRHQRCWSHLFRALQELLLHPKTDEAVKGWINSVLQIWSAARSYRTHCRTKPLFGASVFDRKRRRREFEKKLYALAEPYLEADSDVHPQATLARRIGIYLSELFTFVEFPEVPDDNNAAERAIRPAVIMRKVCGGTRSPKGTKTKAALLTLFETAKVRGANPFAECRAVLAQPP